MELPTLLPPPPAEFPKVLIKQRPEDFIVEEMPLYEPCGSGTHTYIWIEKRGINTHDALRRIASLLGRRSADGGVGGLKDAIAVTRQWISFEHVKENLDALAKLDTPQLKVLKVSAHGNKLRMGHLAGNRFCITLRLLEDSAAARQALHSRAQHVCAELYRRGIPNYYGPQRFGRSGDNAVLGRMLVLGDEDAFKKASAESFNRRAPDRKLRNLIVNAFQSELFNRVLALRMPRIDRLMPGDLACLHRNGAVFAVATAADAAREQQRADANEISPSGPIFGPKMPRPEGVPGEIEARVLSEAGVSADDFGRREAESQPGARRSLRMTMIEPPEIAQSDAGVTVRFALPSGGYASVVLREIVGSAGLAGPNGPIDSPI